MNALRAEVGGPHGFATGVAGRPGMRGTQYMFAPKEASGTLPVAKSLVRLFEQF
jgi:hypothetical protein